MESQITEDLSGARPRLIMRAPARPGVVWTVMVAVLTTGLSACTLPRPTASAFALVSPAPDAAPTSAVQPDAAPASAVQSGSAEARAPLIRRAQRRLVELGYAPGPIDGVAGTRTSSAVADFQKIQGLNPDGRVSTDVIRALDRPRPVAAVLEAQVRLTQLGYDTGPADGIFGRRTARAIRNFERAGGAEVEGRVTPDLLDRLAQAEAAVSADLAPATATEEPEPKGAATSTVTNVANGVAVRPDRIEVGMATAVAGEVGGTESATPTTMTVQEAAALYLFEPASDAPWSTRRIAPGDLVRVRPGSDPGMARQFFVNADGLLYLRDDVVIDAAGMLSYELLEQIMVKLAEAYLLDLNIEILPASIPGQLSAGN